ncbi:MAG: hypothetical protein KJ630_03725 [Proteobacteria bacterium]|nr:hypothetical protein [Pseudomonadota bacterium]
MKVLISAILMVIVAAVLITKMIGSTQESIASMQIALENHFSLVTTGKYREAYDNFHNDLKQRISPEQYAAAWVTRIAKYGPMQSWEIHTANKSSNLFTSEKEYDVVLYIGFGSDKKRIDRVYHIWRIDGDRTQLIYSGLHNGASNSSNFDVF